MLTPKTKRAKRFDNTCGEKYGERFNRIQCDKDQCYKRPLFFSRSQQKGQVKICNFIVFLGFVEISFLNHIQHVYKIGACFTNF